MNREADQKALLKGEKLQERALQALLMSNITCRAGHADYMGGRPISGDTAAALAAIQRSFAACGNGLSDSRM